MSLKKNTPAASGEPSKIKKDNNPKVTDQEGAEQPQAPSLELLMPGENPTNASASTAVTAASLRISQDFAATVGVERVLATVPVKKPGRHDWFRVHPEWSLSPVALIELKEERETYVLTPTAAEAAPGEYNLYSLFVVITRQGNVMLWPVRLPGADGRSNRWHEAAHDAAMRARKTWTRMVANMNLGAYDVYHPKAEFPDPEWPDTTLDAVVDLAFRGRVIDDGDHPVLRRLRGEL